MPPPLPSRQYYTGSRGRSEGANEWPCAGPPHESPGQGSCGPQGPWERCRQMLHPCGSAPLSGLGSTIEDMTVCLDDGTALGLRRSVGLDGNGWTCRVWARPDGWSMAHGSCTGRDVLKAPDGWWTRRLARGRYLRVAAVFREDSLGEASAPAEPPPPASDPRFVTLRHRRVFVQDTGLLALAHERGLVQFTACIERHRGALANPAMTSLPPVGT